MPKPPRKLPLGKIVAQREFDVRGSPGLRVTISIGAPRPYQKWNWRCPYRIKGLGEPIDGWAGGVDSLQALTLAIEGVRVNLDATGLEFLFPDGSTDADIPRLLPSHYGNKFAAKVNRFVDAQVARVWDSRIKVREERIRASERELEVRKAAIPQWEQRLESMKKALADWKIDNAKLRKELLRSSRPRSRRS